MTPAELFDQKHSLAAIIDHTLLKPEATASDIDRLCDEALVHGFAAVCVNPSWVARASQRLKGSPVKVCAVAGFPLGASATQIKAQEAALARTHGADEIDMVLAIGALRAGDHQTVSQDITAVAHAVRVNGGVLKVILETCLLNQEQKLKACEIAVDAGADFVKTSTGFASGGATVEDIRLMREAIGPSVGVKASGGIRTLAAVRSMLAAGATRIGASAGVAIIGEIDGVRPAPAAGAS